MTWFVDASVIVAIAGHEEDWEAQANRLDARPGLVWSAISRWEAIVALTPRLTSTIERARSEVDLLAEAGDFAMVPIGPPEAMLALEAFDRFGKGRHSARLNMGDCFAYACAKTNGARLLYKGHDFALTDLAEEADR